MAVRDVNHDANVIAELDATCMSFKKGHAAERSTIWDDKQKNSSSYTSIRTLLRFWGTIVQ